MIFIGQIYAPTSVNCQHQTSPLTPAPLLQIDRSLYLFCCPSQCSSHSDGWFVIRNQCAGEEETSSPQLTRQDIEQKVDPPKTDWGNVCKSTAGTSNWGNDEDENDDLSDLMDLLNARDHSLNNKITSPPLPPITPEATTSTSPNPIPNSFPSLFGPIWLQEDFESTFISAQRSRLDHEEDLLRKYLDDMSTEQNSGEEDSSILSLLRSQQQVRMLFKFHSPDVVRFTVLKGLTKMENLRVTRKSSGP
jgi:hypothetical protein